MGAQAAAQLLRSPPDACCPTYLSAPVPLPTLPPPPLPPHTDFLSATLDRGGLRGMLALSGIFQLVTRHGLEYPAFYARLYQLLTPEAFQVRAGDGQGAGWAGACAGARAGELLGRLAWSKGSG